MLCLTYFQRLEILEAADALPYALCRICLHWPRYRKVLGSMWSSLWPRLASIPAAGSKCHYYANLKHHCPLELQNVVDDALKYCVEHYKTTNPMLCKEHIIGEVYRPWPLRPKDFSSIAFDQPRHSLASSISPSCHPFSKWVFVALRFASGL